MWRGGLVVRAEESRSSREVGEVGFGDIVEVVKISGQLARVANPGGWVILEDADGWNLQRIVLRNVF
jgi:hypothetical protein